MPEIHATVIAAKPLEAREERVWSDPLDQAAYDHASYLLRAARRYGREGTREGFTEAGDCAAKASGIFRRLGADDDMAWADRQALRYARKWRELVEG